MTATLKPMLVNVLLFAMLRERAGASSIEIELAEGATVADALATLGERPGLGEALERIPLRVAVNREYAPQDTVLSRGDELALVPPVSGGAPEDTAGIHVRVTEEPLDQAAVTALVGRPGAGAIVTFQGTTRDVSKLEYEAYVEMAEEKMREILAECMAEHGLEAIAGEHRYGDVPLGETSVVIAASAAHREEAFAGARAAIDRLKEDVPIWKKEIE